jgi:hypothetical protein
MTGKEKEKQDAIEYLKQSIKPSGKIVISITKVSQSGMSRRMKVFLPTERGLSNLTYNVSKALDLSLNDNGVRVGGCGMDMAFWLAKRLTYALGYEENKELKGNGGSCIDWEAIY